MENYIGKLTKFNIQCPTYLMVIEIGHNRSMKSWPQEELTNKQAFHDFFNMTEACGESSRAARKSFHKSFLIALSIQP